MSYAIICNARKGRELGITTLAYVDRSMTVKRWWTSDNKHIVMRFFKKAAAESHCGKLLKNNARIEDYDEAVKQISLQKFVINNCNTRHDEGPEGWDGHKDTF